MKVIILCVLVCVAIGFSEAAVYASSNPSIHKDHPGKCWHEETKTAIAKGGSFTPKGSCSRVDCGDDLTISGASCFPMVISAPDCEPIPMDLTKPYPSCCPVTCA